MPDADDMNLSSGIAKTVMDKIVDFRVREKALDTARRTQEEEYINERQLMFNNCSRITAGVAFSAGNVCLSDGKIHEKVREQYNNRNQKILDAERKKKEEFEKLRAKVAAVRNKSSDPTKWNASDLQTMVSWFKRPGDSKLPQRKEQLLQRYLLTCNRSEQERNRLKEGEEPVIDDAAAEGGNAEALIPAVGNGDEGGVVEALLQIGIGV